AADPPYNSHLATDAGAGLLASGLVLLVAAWLADRRSTQLALVAFLGFAVPHGAFHVLHDSPGLTSAQGLQNAATLSVTALLAVVLLVGASRSRSGLAARQP
ncbi:MAG: EF-hand domain-containing protein, partial [Acidimicrobiales bacterium]